MRTTIVMVALATVMMLVSCGTKKQTATNDYQYQQYLAQQRNATVQPQYEEQRPTRKLREQPRSEILATEDCDKWRALGTATGYVEKVARNEAARDARNQLAQMMKVAVEGAAQDYERNAQENLKVSSAALGEAVMSQFIAEEVKNTRTIQYDVFDLADGTVQVYACVEIRDTKEVFAKKLSNALERDKLIELQYDRERFAKKMAEGLEEYKKKNNKE